MATTDIDLGLVTAYGYAVSKGYTGTEEQFKTDLANIANKQDKTPSTAVADVSTSALQVVGNQKIDYNALAKAIVEQYSASELCGSAQSVKSAIDGLNNTLSNPDSAGKGNYIGRRVEGGGIIFFDYAIGFKGDVSVAPKTGLNTYHVNNAGIVVKDTTNAADRFYVVQDRDLAGLKDGDQLMWSNGTSGTLYTSLGTSTGFGTGKANTDLAIAAAKKDELLEWNANAYKCIWHYICKGDYQYRMWFVPSKDELNVLLNMQWSTASNRKSYDGNTQLVQLPMNFAPYYWSSSELSATLAFSAAFYVGAMTTDPKNSTLSNRVRLVRTF